MPRRFDRLFTRGTLRDPSAIVLGVIVWWVLASVVLLGVHRLSVGSIANFIASVIAVVLMSHWWKRSGRPL